MTRFRPPQKARQDANQKPIIDALRAMGFKVYVCGQPFDLLICRGRSVWIGEIKDPKKRGWKNEFTKAQSELLEQGWPVEVFYEIADAASFANRVFEEGRSVSVPIVGTVK